MRAEIERLFWTIAFLKPVQIWGRFAYALTRRFKRIPGLAGIASAASAMRNAHQKPARGKIRFSFLSETREYPIDAVEWNAGATGSSGNEVPVKLWRYNLHYFDWLNQGELAVDAEAATYLILDWTARCADDSAEPWEPYPTSRRLESWLKWLRGKPPAVSDTAFMALVRRSISAQVRRLELDREVHIQANHLLKNFLALVLATAWLIETSDGAAPGLRKTFVRHAASLKREMGGQILPDGGHYERSPMYHREMLEGISDVAAAIRSFASGQADGETRSACADLVAACEAVLPAMRAWLDLLTHPDGQIALFHDSALNTYAYKISGKGRSDFEHWLADSGYFVSRRADGDYLALCAHGPSPVHQPGHSHADIGSFELSLQGRRVIVDTGTGSYQNPEIRWFCRSTQAHNVPLIEDSEQSDMWGDFRVGRRACVVRT
ncbi:MAG TPA: alginate lyase family protein, partial [Candidatus Ozemobacteraceae bacterium]|nr:alginate lyase family protein [Candidatus Ozemobacteraceae bacterium]